MDKEIKYDIVIVKEPLLKYSPLAFGTAFTNIEYLLDEKVNKTQKNLESYFKIYGPIVDCEGNEYVFKNVTTFSNLREESYHLNFAKTKK